MLKDDNFIIVPAWAVNHFELSATETMIYSIIYGFSQDGETKFSGSRQYLSEWCHCTTRSVQTALNNLVEKNLIFKEKIVERNMTFCTYKINRQMLPSEKISLPSEKISQGGVKNFPIPSEKISHNNIENKINNIYTHFQKNADESDSSLLSTAEAVSPTSNQETLDEKRKRHFEMLWDIYPRKDDKQRAFNHYLNWLKGKKYLGEVVKLTAQEMDDAIEEYKRQLKARGTDKQYIKSGANFFSADIYEYYLKSKERNNGFPIHQENC